MAKLPGAFRALSPECSGVYALFVAVNTMAKYCQLCLCNVYLVRLLLTLHVSRAKEGSLCSTMLQGSTRIPNPASCKCSYSHTKLNSLVHCTEAR